MTQDAGGERLEGGSQTEVSRLGDVVIRQHGPQSETVIRLLGHLGDREFEAAPRPVDGGFTIDGDEQLTYIEGSSPQPLAWNDEAAWHIGRLVRELHNATSDFDSGSSPAWRPWFARSLPGSSPVIGHGDLGPWNILDRESLPVAFIDWDNAGPVDAVSELAQVAWLNAQLHDDDVAEFNALPDTATRLAQCAAILDGYELSSDQRVGFVDRMIEFALRSTREEAQTYAITSDTTSPAPDGFPILWAVTWRARAAAWMLDHRSEIERAIS